MKERNVKFQKDIELKQEKKVNSYLDKISREHYAVEKNQQEFKKIQMRQNLEHSLEMR